MFKSIVTICILALIFTSCEKEGPSVDITTKLQGNYTGVLKINGQDTTGIVMIVTRISNTQVSITSSSSIVTPFNAELSLNAGIITSSVSFNGDVTMAIDTSIDPYSLTYSYHDIEERYSGRKN